MVMGRGLPRPGYRAGADTHAAHSAYQKLACPGSARPCAFFHDAAPSRADCALTPFRYVDAASVQAIAGRRGAFSAPVWFRVVESRCMRRPCPCWVLQIGGRVRWTCLGVQYVARASGQRQPGLVSAGHVSGHLWEGKPRDHPAHEGFERHPTYP